MLRDLYSAHPSSTFFLTIARPSRPVAVKSRLRERYLHTYYQPFYKTNPIFTGY